MQIQVEYDPRDTGLADAIRALFDVSRERQLEADLARANFYFTTHTRRAGVAVRGRRERDLNARLTSPLPNGRADDQLGDGFSPCACCVADRSVLRRPQCRRSPIGVTPLSSGAFAV